MSDARTPLTVDGLCDLFAIRFTDEQLSAITAPHAPAVVIAGAGSGKTTLMSARVVWLVSSGEVAPDSVLGLTFTNKAAAELSQRVRVALRRLEQRHPGSALLDDGEPTISTYHSYAASLVREYGVWGGYEPAAQLITEAQRIQVAENVARAASGPFPNLGLRLVALTQQLLTLDAELNEHLVDIDDLLRVDTATVAELDAIEQTDGKLTADPAKARATAAGRLELTPLVAEFRRRKRRLEQVDFGDQMASAALLAEQVPEVVAGERARFSTILLDEYQDTSMAQQRLLIALFGDGHPVMAVGDPFQSIYGWRGASVRNIVRFPDDFGDAGPTPVYALGQNNRSGEAILAAANAVAQPLREDFPQVGDLRPRPDLVGAGTIEVALHETAADEVAALGEAVAGEIAAGREPNEIAVLCREAKAFPAIIEALTERSVPVEVVGLGGLLALPDVVEVVAILEVLHDPTANPSLVRLLSGPRWRIGPVDLALLGSRARLLSTPAASGASSPNSDERSLQGELQAAVAGSDPVESVSLIEALEDPGPTGFTSHARHRFAELSAELAELRAVLHQPPDIAIATVIQRIGLDVERAVEGRTSEHLDALLEHARAFSAAGGRAGVGPFLAYLALARRYGSTMGVPAPTSGSGVALLTVHKAKGLEWQSVYLPHVVDGVFPNTTSRSTPHTSPGLLPYPLRGDAADFPVVTTWSGNKGVAAFKQGVADREGAEDRRLAYVAITRAAHRLVVSGHRWGPTQVKPRAVSRYLQVLADLCADGGGTVRCWAPEPPPGAVSPSLAEPRSFAWPPTGDAAAASARHRAADLVRAALRPSIDDGDIAALDEVERAVVASWDDSITALLVEAQRLHVPDASLPLALSATSAVGVLRDRPAVARDLRRPMPRPPAVAAQRGTQFHAWVESLFGQVPLIDVEGIVPDGTADADVDLAELQQSFLDGPYAERRPIAVEALFHMVLGSHTVVGRIDAVYDADERDRSLPAGTRYEVVDWKTGRHDADELQLALYRIAWAELHDVPVDQVAATFYYVASGRVVRPAGLPDRAALTALWDATTT